ncbi:MAG: tol-pal system protein YbgF [Betaproteobacteria bacterium]|nr:tol-pal system protein YbgF [Betaproteobacteria bacterium]
MKRLLPLAASAALFLAVPAQAQLFGNNSEVRQQISDLKQETQGQLETVKNAQFELANQVEVLRTENARLRGQFEVLLSEIESLKNRQRDFYVDLDTRMRQLETSAQAPAPAQTSAPGATTGSGYEAALGFLKEGRASEAFAELETYINANPESDNMPEAHFWAGNAALQAKNIAAANKYFNTVLNRWPRSSVAPDAMLGLANGQLMINDRRNAQKTLQSLIDRYPSSNAAKTAKQHLSAPAR